MDAKISVIVPIYNAEKTLRRCVDALLKQTYRNVEIILVDDGSKDHSLEICQQYAAQDNRVKVLHKPNGGVSSARNAGLDIAAGEFIMFCDSDDWAEPEWCEELISHYEPDCLVICGNYVEGEQPYFPYEVCSKREIERYPKTEFYKLKLRFFTSPWNKIYEARVIRENEIRFDVHISNGEDYLFNLQYLNCIQGEIVLLEGCVFHYVWPTNSSLSGSVPKDYLAQCGYFYRAAGEQFERLCGNNRAQKLQFYTDCFNEYQRGIDAVFRNREQTWRRKVRCVNNVMSSKEYHNCANSAVISPNKIYNWTCRQKNCCGLALWFLIKEKSKK